MFRAHHEDALVARLQEALRGAYRIHESAARSVHVHRGTAQSDLVGDHRGRCGRDAIGRAGREDEKVNVLHVETGVVNCATSGNGTEGGHRAADTALFNTGALLNPLVGRRQRLRELVVRDDAIRYSDAPARKACAHVSPFAGELVPQSLDGRLRAPPVLGGLATCSAQRR